MEPVVASTKRSAILISLVCITVTVISSVFLLGYISDSRFSRNIQMASGKEDFGKGDLLVEFDTKKGTYSKKRMTVFGAQSPEEIGAIIETTLTDDKEYLCVLKTADTGMVIAEKCFSKGEYKTAQSTGNPTGKLLWIVEAWASTQWTAYVEDRDISAFLSNYDKITGTKLAVYSVNKRKFQYTDRWLPEQYHTDSAEELAGYIRFFDNGDDYIYSYKYEMSLCTPDGRTIAEDKLQNYKDIESWLEKNMDGYIYGLEFLSKGDEADMGFGSKLIGYSMKGPSYTCEYIPAELLATSPEEVAYVVKWLRSFEEITETYFPSQKVTGIIETIAVKVVDPDTGAIIADKVFKAEAPQSILVDMSAPSEPTFRQYVKSADVEDWLRQISTP